MFSLQNRVALVTGAGRGIGRAIAISLAQAGAKVGIAARTASELDDAVQTVQKAGGQAVAIAADLMQKDARYPRQMTAKLGPVDILVSNAIGSKPIGRG